jgi:putative ABC transport system permease protein
MWRTLLDSLGQDVRFALRQVGRRPGFTLLIVLTLSVGIGANVAVFSVMKGLILRSLPYPEPERVVAIWETPSHARFYQPFSSPDYFDMREQNNTLEEMGLFRFNWINLAGEENAARVYGVRCTASTLRALGVQPARGRLFADEEEIEGRDRVVILSDRLWRRQYGAVPDIIGRRITVDQEIFEVIGVMPAEYEFPRPWSQANGEPELWVPIVLSRDDAVRGWHSFASVGRLKDGVTAEAAEADLRAIADQLAEAYPNTNAQTQVWIDPLMRRALGSVRAFLIILLGVVGLVLLIACANVASMLLARGTTRTGEIAIRASMGADSGRLVRQLLTESLMLSALGGVAGVAIAFWGVSAVKGLVPANIPRVAGIQIDSTVLAFSLLIVVITGVVFGLAPALFASRTDLVGALREGGRGQAGGRKHNRVLRMLVAGQLATAFVLANGAALLIVSYFNVVSVPRGFDSEEVLVAGLALNGPQYEETHQRVAFWRRLIERLEAVPGIEQAAATNKLPLFGGNNGWILVEGETYDPQERRPLVEYSYVSPDYFDAMGVSLLSGRLLEEADMTVPDSLTDRIAVVNQAFVDRYWPGESVLGRRVRHNSEPPDWTATVVGVVENVRQWGLEYPPLPEMYFPYTIQLWTYTRLVVRASGDPLPLVPALRQAVQGIDSEIPLSEVRTMSGVVKSATERRRFYALLVTLFAVTALILVVAGTYGVMSYYVSQRTHEVGVRMALGADKNSVLKLFSSQGLRLVLLGMAFGLLGSLASAKLTSSMLFGISPFHPMFLIGGALFMTVVAMAAIAVPVFRATRVDPNEALRME